MAWIINQIIHNRYELLMLKRDRPGHQVWLAIDLQSQAKVIIKTLEFTGAIQWDEVKLFEREVQVLQRLNHPQTPSFVDAFDLEQPYFRKCLVESYIHAPSLQAFLDRNQLIPQTQIWAIATQVLRILNDLHSLPTPILHRDLKPSNILIGSNKTVYLIDFGSVGIQTNPLTDNLELPTTVGNYGYTPMEQFRGQELPTSDLYALGATLLQLLTGTHPSELLNESDQLTFPNHVRLTAPLRQWIYQLTEPDSDLRITTAAQALQTLQKAQSSAKTIAEHQGNKVSQLQRSSQITKNECSNDLTLSIEPVWNEHTIATKDLLILFALATVGPLFGVFGMLFFSKAFQGFSLWGADLLVWGLSFCPSVLISFKLFWNLLEQNVHCSSSQLKIKRKVAGVIVQKITLNSNNIHLFQLQKSREWNITVIDRAGKKQDVFLRLPTQNIETFYQALDEWRNSCPK